MTQNCSCHGSEGRYSKTVAAALERPRYSPGLILEDGDLTAAVDYSRALNRLLFRNLFGCGVICGLRVTAKEGDCRITVTVAPGLALDGCGDPVEVREPVPITIDKPADLDKAKAGFWVVLCGKEKMCAPRPLVCESDDYDAATQYTRIRAQAEASVVFEPPQCVCGCLLRTAEMPEGPLPGPTTGGHPAPAPTDPCQEEHQKRDACAKDCGCGTACDCGCCVLLGRGRFYNGKWEVHHREVRRLIRPALLADAIEEQAPDAQTYDAPAEQPAPEPPQETPETPPQEWPQDETAVPSEDPIRLGVEGLLRAIGENPRITRKEILDRLTEVGRVGGLSADTAVAAEAAPVEAEAAAGAGAVEAEAEAGAGQGQ